MAALSITDDAAAGFKLIGKRPVSFAAWALVWIVFGMGPLMLTLAQLMPRFTELMHDAHSWGANGDSSAVGKIMAFELAVWSAMGPWVLLSALVQVVLLGALCRAMLEPGARAFGYLRVGMDELRLFATEVILFVLAIVFIVVLSIVIGLAAWIGSVVGHPWTGWIVCLGVLLAFCAAVYVPFKLSLALPATFAEKKIRVFESWRLTRGRYWSILGMWLLTLVFLIAVMIVVGLVQRLAFFGVAMGTGGWESVTSLVEKMKSGGDPGQFIGAALTALGPAIIVALLLQGVIQTLMRVVMVAPFVAAYTEITSASRA